MQTVYRTYGKVKDNLKPKKTQRNEIPQKKSSLRENTEAIIVAIILALFIRTFIIQAFKIPSGSMLPTLKIGDHILVNKFIYGVKIPFLRSTLIPIKDPKHHDIIVFKYPHDPKKDYIKRVIGVGGDVVKIRDKYIFLNGEKQEIKNYVMYTDPEIHSKSSSPRDNFGPVKVPAGHLFVMGDNRDNSADSRFWGFVGLKAVKGKAFIIYWSSIIPWEWALPWEWDWDRLVIRWKRLGRLLK